MKTFMKKIAFIGAIFATVTIAFSSAVMAKDGNGNSKERMYRVTITNATLGQPIAPSVIATHNHKFTLFELGPTPEVGDDGYDVFFGLATAAETGFPGVLHEAVSVSDGIWEAVAVLTDNTPPVIFPGGSNSTMISASKSAKYLSAAAMLGRTNDAFYGVRSVRLPKDIGEPMYVYANAYDSGSEANDESPETVGALGGTDDNPITGEGINTNGEGYIHVHAGIHGVGGPEGLSPATDDWRNPVVMLTIERIH